MPDAHITLTAALDGDSRAHFGEMLRRSFDVATIDHGSNGITVSVRDDVPPAELHHTLKQLLRVRRYASGDCLFVHEAPNQQNADPQPALEAKGEVCSIAQGLFAFRGDFLRVRTALDSRVRMIAGHCGADELSYPPLWPIPLLQSINYFHDFPHLALLASGVEPEYTARAAFANRFRKGSGNAVIACTAENGLAPAHAALAPTVCDCCYWLLRGRRDVVDQISTIYGQVFRNESSPDGRLDRLTAYTMREIVMVGSEGFVLAKRQALLDEVAGLMVDLDLACNIKAADDPFFSNDALQRNAYQNLSRLKYEVEVPLYDDRKTAVASINLHEDYFSRNYDFENADGARPFSACVGFGYERLTYALFCRHGAKLAAWPRSVCTFLELT